ncbi:ACT domain-containing protein [Desulfonatronum thiosulfatophilum]|uniref:ACT domain-containing protein n=1 Tax=Desulfonatronum thiosulfatophilum TaxID=617002 RepID=A0A1G6DLD8_9BACT|nr:ACT domain-containing protein [Desulfonatronum thiosulfatophilum]SDB45889.1 ACT domain-containing protein [Desulfonatronum thiosulfatophilum]
MFWACITLEVRSLLTAVGFLALITARLARAGISVNPVSAFHHDHLFVPWEMKEHVLAELIELSRSRCENMRNAIRMLKLVFEGEADVGEGRVESQEEVFHKIESSG